MKQLHWRGRRITLAAGDLPQGSYVFIHEAQPASEAQLRENPMHPGWNVLLVGLQFESSEETAHAMHRMHVDPDYFRETMQGTDRFLNRAVSEPLVRDFDHYKSLIALSKPALNGDLLHKRAVFGWTYGLSANDAAHADMRKGGKVS